MGEGKEQGAWKMHAFHGKYQQQVPEGENPLGGPCLWNALFQAGIYTDLPHWTKGEDTPAICQDLGLKYNGGKGRQITLPKDGEFIIGYIIDRSQGLRIGHFEHTKDLNRLLERVNQKDIFAVIEIPRH